MSRSKGRVAVGIIYMATAYNEKTSHLIAEHLKRTKKL